MKNSLHFHIFSSFIPDKWNLYRGVKDQKRVLRTTALDAAFNRSKIFIASDNNTTDDFVHSENTEAH